MNCAECLVLFPAILKNTVISLISKILLKILFMVFEKMFPCPTPKPKSYVVPHFCFLYSTLLKNNVIVTKSIVTIIQVNNGPLCPKAIFYM